MEIQKAAHPAVLHAGARVPPAVSEATAPSAVVDGSDRFTVVQEDPSRPDFPPPPQSAPVGSAAAIQRPVQPFAGEDRLDSRTRLALGAYRTEQASATKDRQAQLSRLLGIDFYV